MRLQTKPLEFRLKLGFKLTELTCSNDKCQTFLWKHVVSSSTAYALISQERQLAKKGKPLSRHERQEFIELGQAMAGRKVMSVIKRVYVVLCLSWCSALLRVYTLAPSQRKY